MKIDDFRLERFFARWEFAVRHVLCASDVEPLTLAELLSLTDEDSLERWRSLSLAYTEPPGLPALREAVARLHPGLEAEDVMIVSGAQEGIFLVLNAALDAGDHAIVVWPAYQSLFEVARASGADVTLLELRPEDGWALDVEALARAVRPDTRLLVVNYPHNPTGAHLDAATFERVVAIAREAGATLLSDEVYRFLELDEAGGLPPAAGLDGGAVSLGVLSKAFGLPGLRIGWLATRDHALLDRAARLKDYTTICASAPSEVLALAALRAREPLLERSRGIVAANLALLDGFFRRWRQRFEWVRPVAGSIAFPRLRHGGDADAFVASLVEEEGVLLLPGSAFDAGRDHFRIGFGRTDMPEALGKLEAFLRRHPA